MSTTKLTEQIIEAAIDVHRALCSELLEYAYQKYLMFELKSRVLKAAKKNPLPIVYKDVKLDHGYRIDLIVENKISPELKTVEHFTDVHSAQILTYMKLGNYQIGYLLTFTQSYSKIVSNDS